MGQIWTGFFYFEPGRGPGHMGYLILNFNKKVKREEQKDMRFQWIQFHTGRGQKRHWALVYRKSREVVMEIWFPDMAHEKEISWLRRKVLAVYSIFYEKALYNQIAGTR